MGKDEEFDKKVNSLNPLKGYDKEFSALQRHDPVALVALLVQMEQDLELREWYQLVSEIERDKDPARAEEYVDTNNRIIQKWKRAIAEKMVPTDHKEQAKEFQRLWAKKLEEDCELRSLHEAVKAEATKSGKTPFEYMRRRLGDERFLQKQAEQFGPHVTETKEMAHAVDTWEKLFENEYLQRPEFVDSAADDMKTLYKQFTSMFGIVVSDPNDDVVERILRIAGDKYNHQQYREIRESLPSEVEKAHSELRTKLPEQYAIHSKLIGLTDAQLRDRIRDNPKIVTAMRKIAKRVRGKINQTHVKVGERWLPRK